MSLVLVFFFTTLRSLQFCLVVESNFHSFRSHILMHTDTQKCKLKHGTVTENHSLFNSVAYLPCLLLVWTQWTQVRRPVDGGNWFLTRHSLSEPQLLVHSRQEMYYISHVNVWPEAFWGFVVRREYYACTIPGKSGSAADIDLCTRCNRTLCTLKHRITNYYHLELVWSLFCLEDNFIVFLNPGIFLRRPNPNGQSHCAI